MNPPRETDEDEWYFEDEETIPLEEEYDEVLRVDPKTVQRLRNVVAVSGSLRLKKFGCRRSTIQTQAAARMAAPPHLILKRDEKNETATYYQYIAGPNFKQVTETGK